MPEVNYVIRMMLLIKLVVYSGSLTGRQNQLYLIINLFILNKWVYKVNINSFFF